MGRGFLILMAMMGFFSVVAGGGGGSTESTDLDRFGATSSSEGSSGSDTGSSSSAGSSDAGAGAVTLERGSDGHFYADVEINGTRVHMLVDTGASGVALSRDAARSAGIATSIGMPQVVGQGADGAVHGEQVRIERMRLGGVSAEGVSAVVLNAGQMSLLGQDFLQRFQSVEIRDNRMVLR